MIFNILIFLLSSNPSSSRKFSTIFSSDGSLHEIAVTYRSGMDRRQIQTKGLEKERGMKKKSVHQALYKQKIKLQLYSSGTQR